MAKKVKYIPASRQKFTAEPVTRTRKKRVAGYARVSTDHEEQATSYQRSSAETAAVFTGLKFGTPMTSTGG